MDTLGIQHIQQACRALAKTGPGDGQGLLGLFQEAGFKYLQLVLCGAHFLRMLGDGLFQLGLGPQPFGVRPVFRAQGCFNFTLSPIPERKGHAQAGGHRFIARLSVILSLHTDVGHPGFSLKPHGMLGLFRELGCTPQGGMLLESLNCQLIDIQVLSGSEEVPLDGELFAE